jgi:nicotinamide mononucleotide transporter
MHALEPAAVALLVASVLLAVQRSLWQYPVGLAATAHYVLVFWRAQLYSSAVLNVVFILAQVYGWWFWLRGDAGRGPGRRRGLPAWWGSCAGPASPSPA